MISSLVSNKLLSDVLKLVAGTGFGRLVLLITLPLVTRLYSPDDFEILAVFASLVGILSAVACLRMEVALPFTNDDEEASNILIIALASTTFCALVSLTLGMLAPTKIARLLDLPDFASFLWLVSVAVFLAGSYNALQAWATRGRFFGVIARARAGQAIVGASATMGLGVLTSGPIGLLVGNALTLGGGVVALSGKTWRDDHFVKGNISLKRMRNVLLKHKAYVQFSTPEALANVVAVQGPVLMIAAAAEREAGQLFLAMQLMMAPMTLIGASVGQVYSSRAAEEMRNGNLHVFTTNTMMKMFLIGVLPILVVAGIGPFAMPTIFGSEWTRAGEIVTLIAPWILFQLIASPVSLVMALLGRQKQMLLLTSLGVLLRVGTTMFFLVKAPNLAVAAYALSGALFYIVCASVFFMATKSNAVTPRFDDKEA